MGLAPSSKKNADRLAPGTCANPVCEGKAMRIMRNNAAAIVTGIFVAIALVLLIGYQIYQLSLFLSLPLPRNAFLVLIPGSFLAV